MVEKGLKSEIKTCSIILTRESGFGNEVSPLWSLDDGGWKGSLRSLDDFLCCSNLEESCSSAGTLFSTDRSISD